MKILQGQGLLAFILIVLPFLANASPLRVATSFSLPADWVRQIGGENVQVTSLVPANADMHAYHPTPADLGQLTQAALIVGIDPSLETWLSSLLSAEGLRQKTFYLGQPWLSDRGIHAHCEKGEHHHPHTSSPENDPHLWMDPMLVSEMTHRLAEHLAKIDPANAPAYRQNAKAYAQALAELDAWSEKTLAAIPTQRRILISNHDNLRRFASRYKFQIPGALLNSTSPETADTSAGKLSRLIQQARQSKTPVFYDNTLNKKLVETVTREARLAPPVLLYTDALDVPPNPAATYLGMYRENVRRITEALK